MIDDANVEEVRTAREAHAATFNDDIDAMITDLQRRPRESTIRRRAVILSPVRQVVVTEGHAVSTD